MGWSAISNSAPTRTPGPYPGQISASLHEHPRPLWHVFARLMQLFPQALPLLQTMQH